jgi:hypothetical protein
MIRKLFYIILLLTVCHVQAWAQAEGDFTPTLPAEPGPMTRLNVKVYPEEAGTAEGGGLYAIGGRAYVSTSPSGEQWRFLRWKDEKTEQVISTNESFSFVMSYGSTTLVAEYQKLVTSALVLECYPKEAKAKLTGGGLYIEGKCISIRAYGARGYKFKNWVRKRNGEVLTSSEIFYFYKTASNDTLIANYEFTPLTPIEPSPAVVYHHVYSNVNIKDGGWVNRSDLRVSVGDNASISAFTKPDYEFVGWQMNGKIVSTEKKYSFIMGHQDVNLTAIFQYSPERPEEPDPAPNQPKDDETKKEPEEPEELEPSTILGDVNGDHRVNILDLNAMNGHILGREVENFIFENADINKDGRVNAVDVSLLLNLIMSETTNN